MKWTHQIIFAALFAIGLIGFVVKPHLKSQIEVRQPFRPEDCLPDEQYMVYLQANYTYELHRAAVANAVNLDTAIYHSFTMISTERFIYGAFLNETALAAVRADQGVWLVECDGSPEPDGDISIMQSDERRLTTFEDRAGL